MALQADLCALPCATRAFDLVVCFRHLQHLRDRDEVAARLTDLARVSRRFLVVSYYSPRSLHRYQRRLLVVLGRRARDLEWTPASFLQAELARLGFTLRADRGLLPGLHAQRLLLAERAVRES